MAVDVKSGAKFEHGLAKPLFEVRIPLTGTFDVSPDGKRFLTVQLLQQQAPDPMTLVLNWYAGLKK
jgi:hypothetical protein